MDKSVIDSFWKSRSAENKGRWTDETLLNYELDWISGYVASNARILDLGSGPGELSSRLMPENGNLTLVEKYPDFLKSAPTGPDIRHVCCDILEFDDLESYELILLFGVVTHLTEDEEKLIYQKAARAQCSNGILIVKNQISVGDEKLVSGYSASLQHDYCGRYPGIEQQFLRLKGIFKEVEVIHYPDQFNPWPDTKHVAFICTLPI